MGRSTFCMEEGMNRGAWTAKEDKLLTDCIKLRGEGKWRTLSAAAGLKRCGKSCRLRWLNYLRPNIKRGNITSDEEDLIIRLHKLLGNRWSLIAGRIPGRTDNEVKNYWNTYLAKRFGDQSKSTNKQRRQSKEKKPLPIKAPPKQNTHSCIVHTKASKCTKLFFDPLQQRSENNAMSNRYGWGDRSISDVYNLVDSGFKKSKEVIQSESCEEVLFPSTRTENDWTDSWMDLDMGGIFTTGFLNSDFQQLYEESHENISENHDNIISDTNTNDNNFPSSLVNPFLFSDNMNWIDEQCVPYHVVNP